MEEENKYNNMLAVIEVLELVENNRPIPIKEATRAAIFLSSVHFAKKTSTSKKYRNVRDMTKKTIDELGRTKGNSLMSLYFSLMYEDLPNNIKRSLDDFIKVSDKLK